MADQKLTYKVDVDTGSAVRDLDKLGDAGEKAGKQIADGFDSAASKSEQAIRALSAQLDQVESDAKGAAEAVSAIKANLTIDVDDSKIAQFASDIKNKMGVAFDDITADAKQFADVLERGVNMDRTRGEIHGVGDELEHVRGESDQSRSVLANLAGNAAQDFGELGGVVGTLGVGIGQLAEYAVDGNIAMSSLARVAGPMAALSAATLLVSQYTQNIAETNAWKHEQVDAYTDAINSAGDSIQAVLTMAEDGLTGRVRDDSILGGLLDKEKTVDLIDLLDKFGLKVTDVQAAIRSGATDRTSFVEWMHSGTPEAQAFVAQFDDLAGSGTRYTELLEGLVTQASAYTEAADGVAKKNRVMASSVDSVNESLKLIDVANNPLAVLADDAIRMGDVMVDPAQLWSQLVDDLRDGKADFDYTAQGIDAFATATGKSKEEIEQLAIEQGKGAKAQADYQVKTAQATDALEDEAKKLGEVGSLFADTGAIISGADWGAASIDATATAMGTFFDTFTAGRDAVAGVQGALDDLQTAFEAQDGLLPNLSTPEGRATFAALEQLGTALIPGIQRAFDQSNGSVTKFKTGMTALYQDTLAQLSNQLGISTDDAAKLLAQIGLTPDNFSTQYELIGDELAMQQLQLLQGVIEGLPREVQARIAYQIQMGDYQGAVATAVNYGSKHPVVMPSSVNTSGAASDLDAFRKQQAGVPIKIPVTVQTTTVSVGGGGGYVKVGGQAAAAPAPLLTPAATPLEGDDEAVTPAASVTPSNVWMPTSAAAAGSTVNRPMTVNVNVSAGVIGNRFDVERAVLRAVRSGTRLRGAAALVAP